MVESIANCLTLVSWREGIVLNLLSWLAQQPASSERCVCVCVRVCVCVWGGGIRDFYNDSNASITSSLVQT